MKALVIARYEWDSLVPLVLANTDYTIEYAVMSGPQAADAVRSLARVREVYAYPDSSNGVFWAEKDIAGLTYDIIARYRYIESAIYEGTTRYTADLNLTKIIYYNALAYWHRVFSTHEFDLVIIPELMHGQADDIIPMEMAKERGIPVYQIEPLMYGRGGLYRYDIDEYVPLAEPATTDIRTAMFYPMNTEHQPVSHLKRTLKSLLSRLGGALLVSQTSDLVRAHRLKHNMFGRPETIYSYGALRRALSIFQRNQRYMRSHAIEPDFSARYIIYYLHFEPEASIMVRCPIKSQLLALQMLAENLPAGYKLYVKEHPHQRLVNKELFIPFLNTIDRFKTRHFFDYIAALPNTYLIDPDVSSQDLTAHAAAIATYHGTAALESVDEHTPVIMFALNKSIFRYVGGILGVRSTADCREALARVAAGYRPDYSYEDFNRVAQTYLFPWRREEGYRMAIKAIYNDMKHGGAYERKLSPLVYYPAAYAPARQAVAA